MRNGDTTVPPESNLPLPHGGDLAAAEALYGQPSEGWIDLSTGINPTPFPVGTIDSDAFTRLPDASAQTALRRAAQAYYGAPSMNAVVCAPGTQALIQWLPKLRRRSRVAVVGPTYGEHAHAWREAGHDVTEIPSPEHMPDDTEVLVAVNPNNPDGICHAPETLLKIERRLASLGGWLIVDEAFADVTPEIGLSAHCEREGLILLRSFGKFFGLAGVRLGFALTHPETADRLNRALGPWAVSGPACTVGTRALEDTTWIEATRKSLAAGRLRLETLLQGHGLEIVGGTDLFVLTRSEGARNLHNHLARTGIWTRAFTQHPSWLRFGQPGRPEHWRRLETTIEAP